MSQYALKSRDIPLNDRWDVIVVGGGPAGCTAAAAAAREGAKTLLIEATGALGGMGTSGLVPAWCPFTDKQKIIYSGMAERVLRETMAGMPHLPKERYDWVPIDPEHLKRVYDDLVVEAGAEILFNTFVTGVDLAGEGQIDVLLAANKDGLTAYRAKVYIDCSGDADLAAWAGAEFHKGDKTGDLQPATHCFVLTNVDMYAYQFVTGIKHSPTGAAKIKDIIASGKYADMIPDDHACNSILGPGAVGFNAGHIWDVDNTDAHSVSRALIHGRKQAKAWRDACAEFAPEAFGNAWLAQTGTLMGIRETRRIVGDYELTVDDYVNKRSFDDEICRNCYFVDIHHKKSEIEKSLSGWNRGEAGSIHLAPGESHGVPYRCLTPRGLTNVIVAGRSISTDRPVQGSTRVMPVCLAMGEAAGIAAHQAKDHERVDVHAVDTDAVRERLREHGAYLP
ncbi:MAG: FAD-dependent oxidoreductase [Phycisphaerae bacterium]